MADLAYTTGSALGGHLRLRAQARGDGVTALVEQSFRAPFHLSKSYWDEASRSLLVQVVNPTAGILAGDRLESSITVGSGAALLLTTPSATRVFQMLSGRAHARQVLQVEAGGWLEVLPEPLVPHRGSDFHQETQLDVAPGGGALYADLLQSGRVAHGEAWLWERLVLELSVRRGGVLVLRERLDASGETLRRLAAQAGFASGAALGNAVWLPPAGVQEANPGWRAQLQALQSEDVWIGISQLQSAAGWSLKWIARDSVALRATLRQIRATLSGVEPRLAADARKL